ncbi:unannotated protein [freshwater metagenome]|uniref:Unannotated protein n=1 Tax=freshwater metagenome TaxID=449393 RepID=A0A6J7JWC5_9ZZZZ|nr:amylo-alpha-1,6-glucosidase [Actinomycetota bacterium]MSW36974.1 amylo-alpha-1,6-glucosidase [Actinomycetota bacterium]
MTEGWAFTGTPPPTAVAATMTTVIEGSSFCISASTGNIIPGAPMGLFVRDTRIVSEWLLEVDGERLEPLSVTSPNPFRAQFVTRSHPRPGLADSTVLVVREREVSEGMRERISVHNLGREAAGITISLRVAADFADLFEVKEQRLRPHTGITSRVTDGALELRQSRRGHSRGVRILAGPATSTTDSAESEAIEADLSPGHVSWHLAVPARTEWSCTVIVEASIDDVRLLPLGHDGIEQSALAADRRAQEWLAGASVLTTPDASLTRTLQCSIADLGSLRIFDAEHPDRAVVAAGAPWFMTLFGRDSLIASWMLLLLDYRLALGTLQALAADQGRRVNPLSEEQPGRILHEMRFGRSSTVRGGGHVYYGSIDSTPLFVMLLGELRRWGLSTSEVQALLPAADRALEWMTASGDRDGDGFLEYERATDRGLRNQGWKDSFDGVNFADGRLADAPIALCEVQGYAYAAYVARAHFARDAGDMALSERWAQRAADLKVAFNEKFWLPDRGWYAIGLDRDKRPIDALASNMAHCLWTGIVDEDKAADVAAHLVGPDLFSGWGIRTLGRSMGAFNPMSYHNGSVWPHDNAIAVAGLVRYGFTAEAQLVASAILEAADHFGGRLPELFCGFDRADFDLPVPYPTSGSPQAWAAAAPILMLRSLLQFDPGISRGDVRLTPVLPAKYLPFRLDNVGLAGTRVAIEVTTSTSSIEGLPEDVTTIHEPRSPGIAIQLDGVASRTATATAGGMSTT